MAAMLERDEWKAFSDFLALAAAALGVIVGLILALAGTDRVIAFHGCILLGAAGLASPEDVRLAAGGAVRRPQLVRAGEEAGPADLGPPGRRSRS